MIAWLPTLDVEKLARIMNEVSNRSAESQVVFRPLANEFVNVNAETTASPKATSLKLQAD